MGRSRFYPTRAKGKESGVHVFRKPVAIGAPGIIVKIVKREKLWPRFGVTRRSSREFGPFSCVIIRQAFTQFCPRVGGDMVLIHGGETMSSPKLRVTIRVGWVRT